MTDSPGTLGEISGGRVLDVGTGRGGSVESLIEELRDYDEIIGIDTDASLADEFAAKFADNPRVRFQVADAMALPFEGGSFDTVSVSASLHHLADLQLGLREMMRVLRPGGHFIVVEMYRDGLTDAQETHVMLHHWWAAVDRLRGTVHRETYTRSQIVDLVSDLDLANLTIWDESYLDGDPRSPKQLAPLQTSIDTYSGYAEGHPDLIAQGAEIRERLEHVGFQLATILVAVGRRR